jgi:LysM repeat protein
MKNILITAALLLSLHTNAQTGAYNEQARAYINKYKAWAIEEQQRTGVPAAITLAQGIHETQAGTSELATEANNHFGIKCKKSWTGETYAHTDDAPDECFRKYARVYDSYKDHSDYLRQTPRYARCFEQHVTDYTGWARELKAAGYATNPRYAQKLIRIVEDFHLQDYTYAALKAAPQPQAEGLALKRETVTAPHDAEDDPATTEPAVVRQTPAVAETPPLVAETTVTAPEKEESYTEPAPVYGQLVMRNNLKGFHARKGDVLLEPAIKYNMRYAKLLELNDLPDAPLEADMFIYTEKKRGLGVRRQHTVQPGESMLQIAQAEGIQLRQLCQLNSMVPGQEPAPGSVLNLQTMATDRPAISETQLRNDAPAPQQKATYTEPEMIVTEHAGENIPEEAVTTQPAGTETEAEVAQLIRKVEVITKEELPMPVAKPQQVQQQPVAVAQPVARQQQTQVRPAPAPPRQKTYTIADELAVGEERNPKYSPRYRAPETAAEETNAVAAQTPPPPAQAPEEPQDEFSRLKARLDKAVYAQPRPAPAPRPAEPVAQPQQQTEPVHAAATDNTPVYHMVKNGETAFSIAKQNNITMKQLREWNNLNFEALKTGQKLRVK